MAFNAEPEAEMLPREEVVGMEIEAIPGRSKVLAGARNALQVVVRISTPKIDESLRVRPPLHVACVMDCSGSMGGKKLDYAKKAVLKLVKHLSAQDTLHFVTYDTDARIVFQDGDLSETGKEALRQQVEAVRAQGQTNLCGGLDAAASLLQSGAEGGRLNSILPFQKASVNTSVTDHVAMRRIFLFSDGHVNVGITDPQDIKCKVSNLANAGITTSSFGIGADFDEPLMRGIATSGQGRYQFLATAQDIPKLVSKSVHDLIDIYASDAVLDLRGGEHTIVSRVYGGHDDDEDGGQGANVPGVLHLGDIHSDNLRVVLAELDVAPPGNIGSGVSFDAAEWVLTCQRHGAPVSFSGKVELQTTRDRAALGDEAAKVQMAFAVRRATDLEREVAIHLSRRERQQAREIKSKQIALLQAAFQAGQRQESTIGDVGKELELLTVVLERAQQVAARLEDEEEDEEIMARQCWQDRDDFSAASVCDLRARSDSSPGGDDVANLRDLRSFSPTGSPRRDYSFSPGGSPFSSPPGTPPRSRDNSPHRHPRQTQTGCVSLGSRIARMLPRSFRR